MRDSPFDRRAFLKSLTLLTGTALYGCKDTESAPVGSGDAGAGDAWLDVPEASSAAPTTIVVLGAGLAGLSTAWELQKAGFEVLVLEAQGEVGGRVKTWRDGLVAGHWAEVGAVRVPDVHFMTQEYATKLKLQLVQYTPGKSLNYLKGERFVREEGDPWPATLALTAKEKEKGLRVLEDYLKAFYQEIGDAKAASWPSDALVQKFDGLSLTEHLKAQGASDDFVRLYRGDSGTEVDVANALVLLGQLSIDKNWNKTYIIKGGNDQLPLGLAKELGDRVVTGAKVTRLASRDGGLTVTYEKNGAAVEVAAARVVCTLPPPLVRKLTVEAGLLSAEKKAAYDNAKMMSAGRVYLQTKRKFWQDEGLGGLKMVRTDLPIERIWDTSNPMDGTAGQLMVYVQHDNAKALAALPEAGRAPWALEGVKTVFPAIATEHDGVSKSKVWQDDPWTEGAWYSPEKGDARARAALAKPEGRLHFGGEHTSIWAGWMNGAIESGKRVAMEIQAAKGTTASLERGLRDTLAVAVRAIFG